MKKEDAIINRQEKERGLLLEQLRKTPIVQLACERSGVGRTTYYRWRREDDAFRALSDEAMRDGEGMINDLSESQILAMIKDRNFPAIQLWLRQHHPKYGNKVEITTKIKTDEPLTPEQEKLVREMLGTENGHA